MKLQDIEESECQKILPLKISHSLYISEKQVHILVINIMPLRLSYSSKQTNTDTYKILFVIYICICSVKI